MIAAAAMTGLPSVPTPGDAAPSTPPAEASPQNAQAPDAASASAKKPGARADGKTHAAHERGGSDFDRLLEPKASTPAPPDAPQAAEIPHEDSPTATKDATPATAAASLADQLLGLLGALPAAVPGTGAMPAGTTPAGPAPTQAPTVAATPAKPQGTATAPTALPSATSPSSPAATAATARDGKADGGAFATLLSGVAGDGAPADAPAPVATDPVAIASRDTPLQVLGPAPAAVDKLPAVPQPALVQPADPRSGYGDELGSSIAWMAEQRLGHAQLQVSPDHLGPIEVRLQIDGARVHAEFYSAQPDVRHALESSLPRLREMLGQQGLQLGQADVGQRERNDTPRAPMPGNGQSDCFPDDPRPLPTALRRVRGLVDEYA